MGEARRISVKTERPGSVGQPPVPESGWAKASRPDQLKYSGRLVQALRFPDLPQPFLMNSSAMTDATLGAGTRGRHARRRHSTNRAPV